MCPVDVVVAAAPVLGSVFAEIGVPTGVPTGVPVGVLTSARIRVPIDVPTGVPIDVPNDVPIRIPHAPANSRKPFPQPPDHLKGGRTGTSMLAGANEYWGRLR
jgi:hypothetical protein